MRSSTSATHVRVESRFDFVDLTRDLVNAVKESGVQEGCVIAYCAHTTCGLLINEWEEGALSDLRERLEVLVPPDTHYSHDDLVRRGNGVGPHEPKNGRAHVAQMILGGTSHAIPVRAGEPALGTWQRLLLVELDASKEREILFHVFGQ